jgi:hypothetical protein
VNSDVIGFIALDEILGLFFGGVVGVAFERHIGNDFLHDSAANSTCFRIPFDVITAFERLGHLPSLPNRRWIAPSNGQEESAI